MPKTSPFLRWEEHVLERVAAFRQSLDLRRLRRKGLTLLGASRRLTDESFSDEFWGGKVETEGYKAFQDDCREAGARFGLAAWTVEWICVLKSYRPEEALNVVEARWPKISVITEAKDKLFLRWLLYEATQLNLGVTQRRGAELTQLIAVSSPRQPDSPLTDSNRPPLDVAMVMNVETPAGYPPEAGAELQNVAANCGRDLGRRLGYKLPQRMRSSRWASKARELRVSEEALPPGAVYKIADAIFGEQGLEDDQALRSRVKSARHRVKKRFF